MPDKKLTDSEIIKAFKCCADINDKRPECPLKDKNIESCVAILMSNALDLINRLQEKVEYYKKSRDDYQDKVMFIAKQCDELQAENERLQEAIDEQDIEISSLWKRIEEAKAEAYKEFAEMAIDRVEKAKAKYQRLCKEQGEKMEDYMHIHFNGITKIINNLLKELVGEDNSEQVDK